MIFPYVYAPIQETDVDLFMPECNDCIELFYLLVD